MLSECYNRDNKTKKSINCKAIHGIQGHIKQDAKYIPGETFLQSPGSFAADLTSNFAISVVFEDPRYPADYIYKAKILDGAKVIVINILRAPRSNIFLTQGSTDQH